MKQDFHTCMSKLLSKKGIFAIELESMINNKKMLNAKKLIFLTPEKRSSILESENPSHSSAVLFTKTERLSNVLVGILDRLGLKLESNPQEKIQLSHV